MVGMKGTGRDRRDGPEEQPNRTWKAGRSGGRGEGRTEENSQITRFDGQVLPMVPVIELA